MHAGKMLVVYYILPSGFGRCCVHHQATRTFSSSSISTTAHCGFWPVEQYPSIFFYPSPTFSIFSLPALKTSFYFLFPSFPGSSPSSRPFQFLSEDHFGHPILLHALQVTQPTYLLAFYPFYYIFSLAHLFQFSIRPTFPFPVFIYRTFILLNIFLSKINRTCSSFFVKVHASAPCDTTGLISVLYNIILVALDKSRLLKRLIEH